MELKSIIITLNVIKSFAINLIPIYMALKQLYVPSGVRGLKFGLNSMPQGCVIMFIQSAKALARQ